MHEHIEVPVIVPARHRVASRMLVAIRMELASGTLVTTFCCPLPSSGGDAVLDSKG